MILSNLTSADNREPIRIGITGSRIASVDHGTASIPADPLSFSFEGDLVFPGLINSHDHLDFNCFPTLGTKTYANYVAWGDHIHADFGENIAQVLRIPPEWRVQWGLYKNLLGGVTTVMQHGRHRPLATPFIRVGHRQSIHSVRLEAGWKKRLNDPRQWGRSCAIHIGEGTDGPSRQEIDSLIRWNLLRRPLIGVHGVSMTQKQASRFKGLVWCPASNFFLLGKTADVEKLGRSTALLFGTDSTLTAPWNIWEHLRMARHTGQVADGRLFQMLTDIPAHIWGLNTGSIAAGREADLVIARPRNRKKGWDAFYGLNPEDILLVIQGGEIRLADEKVFGALSSALPIIKGWSPVGINGSVKYLPGDLPALIRKIKTYHPATIFPTAS